MSLSEFDMSIKRRLEEILEYMESAIVEDSIRTISGVNHCVTLTRSLWEEFSATLQSVQKSMSPGDSLTEVTLEISKLLHRTMKLSRDLNNIKGKLMSNETASQAGSIVTGQPSTKSRKETGFGGKILKTYIESTTKENIESDNFLTGISTFEHIPPNVTIGKDCPSTILQTALFKPLPNERFNNSPTTTAVPPHQGYDQSVLPPHSPLQTGIHPYSASALSPTKNWVRSPTTPTNEMITFDGGSVCSMNPPKETIHHRPTPNSATINEPLATIAENQKYPTLTSLIKLETNQFRPIVSDMEAEFDEEEEINVEDVDPEISHNEQQIFFTTLRKFLHLGRVKLNSSLTELRLLVTGTKECIKTLEDLGHRTKYCDGILCFHVLEKLNKSTRFAWDAYHKSSKIPELDILLNFLEKRGNELLASQTNPSKETKSPVQNEKVDSTNVQFLENSEYAHSNSEERNLIPSSSNIQSLLSLSPKTIKRRNQPSKQIYRKKRGYTNQL